MADVDEELESYRELVVHHTRGDEHALRAANIVVAMADSAVAEFAVVALGDTGIVAFTDR